MAAVSYTRYNPHDAKSFAALYAIYRASIIPREQKPEAQLWLMLQKLGYRVLLAHSDGEVVGFAIVYVAAGAELALLEYMAVVASLRSQGVGAELFRQAAGMVQEERPRVPLLLEVDSEDEPSPDQAIRSRRQAFYRRLGCLRVEGCDYLLPLPGAGPPPKMDLLVYFSDGPPRVARMVLQRWLEAVYVEVYDQSPHDPRIAQMIAAVSDPVQLV